MQSYDCSFNEFLNWVLKQQFHLNSFCIIDLQDFTLNRRQSGSHSDPWEGWCPGLSCYGWLIDWSLAVEINNTIMQLNWSKYQDALTLQKKQTIKARKFARSLNSSVINTVNNAILNGEWISFMWQYWSNIQYWKGFIISDGKKWNITWYMEAIGFFFVQISQEFPQNAAFCFLIWYRCVNNDTCLKCSSLSKVLLYPDCPSVFVSWATRTTLFKSGVLEVFCCCWCFS